MFDQSKMSKLFTVFWGIFSFFSSLSALMFMFNISVTQSGKHGLFSVAVFMMQKSRRSHHFMQAVDSNVAFAKAAR